MKQQLLKQFAEFLKPHKYKILIVLISLSAISALILSFGSALRFLADKGIGNIEDLKKVTIYCLFIGIAIGIASFLRSYNINSLCEQVVADIRIKAYSILIYRPISHFETKKTSDLISRLTNDTTLISTIISDIFSFSIRNSFMAIGGIILMFNTSSKLALIMISIISLIIPPIIIFGRRIRQFARITQEKTARLSSEIEETFNAIKTIQAFNAEKLKIKNFHNISDLYLSSALNRFKYRSIFFSFVIILIISAIILILWVGINDIISGKMTAGELISFLYFSMQTSLSIGGVSEVFSEIQRAFAAMERVFELLDVNQDNSYLPYVKLDNDEISFENVEYSYPTRLSHIIIKNFTLKISPGSFIGIVGKSGSGKSTIFQILLKFFDVNSGKINIGKYNINNIPLEQLRAKIAVVPQEPFIFSTTAKENILIAKPEATDEEIFEAAKLAGIYEYINSLPEKFDSFLGEKGGMLSSGQKQRIAIARAILKNPDILLLDEATSALDSTNEIQILENLRRLMRGKIIVSIAHRIDTIKDSDIILVIDNGQIIASGKHQELMESSELYKRLNYTNFSLK